MTRVRGHRHHTPHSGSQRSRKPARHSSLDRLAALADTVIEPCWGSASFMTFQVLNSRQVLHPLCPNHHSSSVMVSKTHITCLQSVLPISLGASVARACPDDRPLCPFSCRKNCPQGTSGGCCSRGAPGFIFLTSDWISSRVHSDSFGVPCAEACTMPARSFSQGTLSHGPRNLLDKRTHADTGQQLASW